MKQKKNIKESFYKIILIMKLSYFLIFLLSFPVAASLHSQDESFNFQAKNVELRDVFEYIESNSDYRFFYPNNKINLKDKITLKIRDASIEELLSQALRNQELNYKIFENNLIVISPFQEALVKGQVKDGTGNPLPFVTISEKGTTNGTVSDENGYYEIRMKDPDGILVFSYVGYLTEEVYVGGKNEINIKLVPDLHKLDELVVVGYGTQKKSDLTGAVVSVSSEELEKASALNLDQALQGKAAGVQIMNNTGSPGSSMSVRIRGMGSLNAGQQPLYVIDGFILGDQSFGKKGSTSPDNKIGIGFLDPSEIESIEILKDASASAIYGSRGANGVVLITTKKGKAGKGRIDFSMYRGVQSAPRERYWDVMSGPQYRDYLINRYKNDYGDNWLSLASNPESPIEISRLVDEEGNPKEVIDYNWQDAIFRQATIQNYKLATSGGNETSTYLFSGSFFDQDGLMGNSGIKRVNIRSNGEHQVTDWFKVGANLIGSYSFRERTSEGGYGGTGVLPGAVYADPTLTPKDSAGNWTYFDKTTTAAGNSVYKMQRDIYHYKNFHYYSTGFLTIQIFPSLVFHTTAGIDISYGNMESFDPAYFLSATSRRDHNSYYYRQERWLNWDIENTLTYQKSFKSHDLTVLGGFTTQKESFIDWRSHIPQFPYDEEFMRYPNVGDASLIKEFASSPMEYSIMSLLGRMMYSYKDKLLLTASFRRDGSSKFGPENRYGNFPSFSVGYNISEEKFMQNIAFLNMLKVRAGWGQLGNQAIPPYRYAVAVNVVDVITPLGMDEEIQNGALPDGAANEDIKWETSTQTNIGIDVGMFQNRFTLTVDAFDKYTYNMLLEVPIPQYVGIISPRAVNGSAKLPIVNIAEMENKGIESVMVYKLAQTNLNGFYFNLNANFSYVKNKVLSLGDGFPIESNRDSKIGIHLSRTEENRSIAEFHGYSIAGIFKDSAQIANSPFQVNVRPGDYMFKDIDGNDTITTDDRIFLGSPLPKFNYGFGIDMGYKNFDFYLQFMGVQGNKIVNGMRYYLYGDDATNKAASMVNSWSEENPDADLHRFGNHSNNMRFSDFYIEDGSFLRIKNLTIGYSLPKNVLSKINASNIRIYGSVQNLYTFTNYTGMEPEVGQSVSWSADPLDIGLDAATYPHPRTFMVGMNISF